MCQCPQSGLSHFYTAVVEEESDEDECVNALSRAYPISTDDGKGNGDPEQHVCQCPKSGLSHFYEKNEGIDNQISGCVNALSRAYPISTVSLKKPAKINGFQTRFQGVIIRIF